LVAEEAEEEDLPQPLLRLAAAAVVAVQAQ
jgi:hypothetical protein